MVFLLVGQLSEKIIHFLIKAPNVVQHLLNSYYFIGGGDGGARGAMASPLFWDTVARKD